MKILANLFKDPEEIDKSTVTIDPEITEKTKTEAFDDAVKAVLIDRLSVVVFKQLREYVFGKDVVEQTQSMMKDISDVADIKEYKSLKKKYPKAAVEWSLYYNHACSKELGEIRIDDLARKIVSDELSKEETK